MYSISSGMMRRSAKVTSAEGKHTLPATEANNPWAEPQDLQQSYRNRATPFCRYNDGIVGRIEFEIVRRTEVGSHES